MNDRRPDLDQASAESDNSSNVSAVFGELTANATEMYSKFDSPKQRDTRHRIDGDAREDALQKTGEEKRGLERFWDNARSENFQRISSTDTLRAQSTLDKLLDHDREDGSRYARMSSMNQAYLDRSRAQGKEPDPTTLKPATSSSHIEGCRVYKTMEGNETHLPPVLSSRGTDSIGLSEVRVWEVEALKDGLCVLASQTKRPHRRRRDGGLAYVYGATHAIQRRHLDEQ